MEDNDKYKFKPDNSPQRFYNLINSSSNLIAIYTAIRILLKMRKILGLEAMLGYMESYVRVVNEHNKKLNDTVETALWYLNVERMYREAMK